MYITKEVEVEVEVELSDFDTDDLVDELQRRQCGAQAVTVDVALLVENIYQKRRTGQDYQKDLDELIYQYIGRFN